MKGYKGSILLGGGLLLLFAGVPEAGSKPVLPTPWADHFYRFDASDPSQSQAKAKNWGIRLSGWGYQVESAKPRQLTLQLEARPASPLSNGPQGRDSIYFLLKRGQVWLQSEKGRASLPVKTSEQNTVLGFVWGRNRLKNTVSLPWKSIGNRIAQETEAAPRQLGLTWGFACPPQFRQSADVAQVSSDTFPKIARVHLELEAYQSSWKAPVPINIDLRNPKGHYRGELPFDADL